MAARKLLSLWSPWWWMCLMHTKRRENREWPNLPSYRGECWIHAALKVVPDVMVEVEAILGAIPLMKGKKPPTAEDLAAGAGHIVGKVRILEIERNTPAVCLRDPWAMEGQLGIVFDQVEILSTPIPWRGAQGLVEVDPNAVEFVRVITEAGGKLDLRAMPASVIEDFGRSTTYSGGSFEHQMSELAYACVEQKQLRREGNVVLTRTYKADAPPPTARPARAKKPPVAAVLPPPAPFPETPPAATARATRRPKLVQQTFGW